MVPIKTALSTGLGAQHVLSKRQLLLLLPLLFTHTFAKYTYTFAHLFQVILNCTPSKHQACGLGPEVEQISVLQGTWQ